MLLSIENPNRRRFSSNAAVAAYALNIQSPRAYEYVRNNLLVLPSSRHLRQISSNISVSVSVSFIYLLSADVSAEYDEYFKTKTKYLKPQELYVNVQLDEIHIRPCVTYKNGRLTGTNEEGETATSIHCFLISSLLSNNKDVVALVPAKKITTEKLCSFLKSVLKTVTSAGYSVISIINDGNRINKKMFHLIAGCPSTTDLPVHITNPNNQERPIAF